MVGSWYEYLQLNSEHFLLSLQTVVLWMLSRVVPGLLWMWMLSSSVANSVLTLAVPYKCPAGGCDKSLGFAASY